MKKDMEGFEQYANLTHAPASVVQGRRVEAKNKRLQQVADFDQYAAVSKPPMPIASTVTVEEVHYMYGVYCRQGTLTIDSTDGLDQEVWIFCNEGRVIQLSEIEYIHQLNRPDSTWRCPICRGDAMWDDDSITSA